MTAISSLDDLIGSSAKPVKDMGHLSIYNLAIVLFVASGSFTYGFNSSIIGSVTGLPSFYEYFELTDGGDGIHNKVDLFGAMNSAFAAGGLIGSLCTSSLADRLGRKPAIQIIAIACIIATILSTASVHVIMFVMGRALQGFGAGMINTACPIFQAEVSTSHSRGRMVGMHATLLVCGYASASWAGLGTFFLENPSIQWRLCIALQLVAPLLLLLGSPWLPESPRWLIHCNRNDEGLRILVDLHKRQDDPQGLLAQQEYQQITQQIALDRQSEMSWIKLWASPSTRKRMLMGFFVIATAQSTGNLVVNNYQVQLYAG